MSKERFDHTLQVIENAIKLAELYKENVNDTETAALLHDLTREWDFSKVFNYIKLHNINITDEKRDNPILLHGLVASIVTKEEFGINNINVINSIKNHTLGSKNMSQLEKIIFLSDFLASKTGTSIYVQVFDTAKNSLDEAVLLVYELTYGYLRKDGVPIAKELMENWEAAKLSAIE